MELKNILGGKIMEATDECYQIAKMHYPGLSENFYYSLAVHLSAAYERLLNKKSIINPAIEKIKRNYETEYKIAGVMASKVSKMLMVDIPDEEVGFIAMYIKNFSHRLKTEDKVNVVLLTHGKVGKSIVEVVNKLLNTDHAKGIEMGLDENPKEALERTIDLIQKTDMKKGTVLMVDMGSLTTFGEVITKRTGIEVRVLDRVDTLLALDVTRRALVPEATLDDVVSRVEENGRKVKRAKGKINEYNYDQNLPKAIVTICITGDGSAEKLKEYVSKVIDKTHSSLTVISIGVISPVDIDLRIRRIMDNYNVVAFVGTIDPEIVDVPFISIQNLLDYKGIEQIQKIVMEAETKRESIDDLLDEDLVFFDKSFKGKDEAIDFLVEKMQAKGYVDKNFLLSVYKREMMVPTYLKGGIAIPHGFPQYVTKPVISILKLPQKMTWMGDEGEVDLIFLIAYKNNSKKYFQNVYKILLNQEIIQKMKAIEKERDMIDFMKMHASE